MRGEVPAVPGMGEAMAGRRWTAALLGLCLGAQPVPGQTVPPAGIGTPRAVDEIPAPAALPVAAPVEDSAMAQQKEPPKKEPAGPILAPPTRKPSTKGGEDEFLNYLIQLDPPGTDRLFRLESESAFRERIRQEERAQGRKVEFPDRPAAEPLSGTPWRTGAMLFARAEAGYLCYRRTWFQQRNFERYGWDVGPLTPGVCAGLFFVDVAALPLHWLVDPLRRFECSAGLCLPGDPVPMLWYPLGTK